MINFSRRLIIDKVFYYDEIDNEVNIAVHDPVNHKNILSLFALDYLVPDKHVGAVIEGILAVKVVTSAEKCPAAPLCHFQNKESIIIDAVVEVAEIISDYEFLAITDIDDKRVLVTFENEVHVSTHDIIHIKGELHLVDSDEMNDLLTAEPEKQARYGAG